MKISLNIVFFFLLASCSMPTNLEMPCGLSCLEDLENAGDIVIIDQRRGIGFGDYDSGLLISYRHFGQNDYLSLFIHEEGQLEVKDFSSDQAAEFRISDVFNFRIDNRLCIVILEEEGGGILYADSLPSEPSRRAEIYCERMGQSQFMAELSDFVTDNYSLRGEGDRSGVIQTLERQALSD